MSRYDTSEKAKNLIKEDNVGQKKILWVNPLRMMLVWVLSLAFFSSSAAGIASAAPATIPQDTPVSLVEPSVALWAPFPTEPSNGTAEGAVTPPDTVEAASRVSSEVEPVKEGEPTLCKNWLNTLLYETGFRGKNLREAWALVMRESGGREDAVSPTGDYGMFQFNRAAWSGEEWWNTNRLLTREYNAKIAYRISEGGKTWYPWDINGKGDHLGRYTSTHTYSKFREWYKKYPC